MNLILTFYCDMMVGTVWFVIKVKPGHIQMTLFPRGLTKQRKERSFRERKIFIRKEHFITLLQVQNNFKCLFLH